MGRFRKPGFITGTVQNAQEYGQPRVAWMTFLIKNLSDSKS
jgi:hypothetical protein